MRFILGSSSKFRKWAFAKVVAEFETMSPDINEKAIRDTDPYKLTLKLAQAKAEALLPKLKEPSILVTGDQVVSFHGQILEKPESEQQAREFMRAYQNDYAEVINAVVVVNTKTGKQVFGNDVVRVWFHTIPDTVIEELIREGEAMICACALKVEHPALVPYIKLREGTDESLHGIPTDLVRNLIAQVL